MTPNNSITWVGNKLLKDYRHLIFVVNASQRTSTHMPEPLRISHIYGETVIESLYCQECNQRAFVIRGKLTCCNRIVSKTEAGGIKIEVDTEGKRRKKPSRWIQGEILAEQKNCCYYCGEEFGSWFNRGGQIYRVSVNWDHVIPYCYNHNNYEFVASCRKCNNAKAGRVFNSLQEARQYVRETRGL